MPVSLNSLSLHHSTRYPERVRSPLRLSIPRLSRAMRSVATPHRVRRRKSATPERTANVDGGDDPMLARERSDFARRICAVEATECGRGASL